MAGGSIAIKRSGFRWDSGARPNGGLVGLISNLLGCDLDLDYRIVSLAGSKIGKTQDRLVSIRAGIHLFRDPFFLGDPEALFLCFEKNQGLLGLLQGFLIRLKLRFNMF